MKRLVILGGIAGALLGVLGAVLLHSRTSRVHGFVAYNQLDRPVGAHHPGWLPTVVALPSAGVLVGTALAVVILVVGRQRPAASEPDRQERRD